ncbi:hypothetical protein Moror_1837 [Moniliophthora roreri MCA 2997]|uniref:Uncharacterized protein n=1 Tax=Moniliophthora roreri (strain MCA 2997) TaxID=1381753 RepID=V2X4P1_MONRO|nr:hypothetical protein Moror_1837 [Moniliophthora roreri MCA 2997]
MAELSELMKTRVRVARIRVIHACAWEGCFKSGRIDISGEAIKLVKETIITDITTWYRLHLDDSNRSQARANDDNPVYQETLDTLFPSNKRICVLDIEKIRNGVCLAF